MYQVTVFISRSSISLGFPPLPEKLLPVPAILQLVILLTLVYESAIGIFGDSSEGASFYLVFWLICIEGLCGGLALYVIILHFLRVLILTLSLYLYLFAASTCTIGLTWRSRILLTPISPNKRKSSRSVRWESRIRLELSWPFYCPCLLS